MLTVHKSHQIGLDVDIWLKPKAYTFLSISERETVPPISMSKSGGALVNHNWTETHHKVLREISKDERVARIFIFPGAKVKMCREEKGDKNIYGLEGKLEKFLSTAHEKSGVRVCSVEIELRCN